MKQGSIVHKELEDQVYTTVKVDIETREDAWGLRIWNVIQGLRTLRDIGTTRELEIWGTIDGLVVNGVIDELSFTCPDLALEASPDRKPPAYDEPSPDQSTISEFFKASGDSSVGSAIMSKRRPPLRKVYICDVKTRSVKSLPNGVSFRPTKMQLMLYHHLLSALATASVDFSALATRYNLDDSKVFSDSFIMQVGSLNDEIFYDARSNPSLPSQDLDPSWSQDSTTTLLQHNCLSALWSLMMSEFQLTLPEGDDSVGSVLKAEYRSRGNGEILGSKTFAMDQQELKAYLDHEMQWWKGEREAQGVAVDEAYKCRTCEFAENCEWRIKKVEQAIEKSRMARKRSSAV